MLPAVLIVVGAIGAFLECCNFLSSLLVFGSLATLAILLVVGAMQSIE